MIEYFHRRHFKDYRHVRFGVHFSLIRGCLRTRSAAMRSPNGVAASVRSETRLLAIAVGH